MKYEISMRLFDKIYGIDYRVNDFYGIIKYYRIFNDLCFMNFLVGYLFV